MAIHKDPSTSADRARVVDMTPPGKVIYRSDFDAGYDGWTDHWDGYRPWPIISVTEEMQLRGRRSLMLSTGEHASPVAGDVSNGTAAFKRLARHDEYRYHHLSAWVALGIGGFSSTWDSFALMIDTQRWDNTGRSFYKLICGIRTIAETPGGSRWKIRGDGGEADLKTITGADGTMIGNNDNKQNFVYVRLTVDFQANSGAGGYHEAQIGPQVFDLTSLGAGHALEPPQFDGTYNSTDFRGGFNIGLAVNRNTSAVGGCQLYADDIVYSVSNEVPA